MQSFEFTDEYYDTDFTLISNKKSEILYFDLETTGLSAGRSDLYIIGISYADSEKMKTILLFNDDGCSEAEMLQELNTYLENKKYLVTYNGDTFDIPYITAKYMEHEMEASDLKKLISVDIYKKLRPYKKHMHLDSMKQSDMEKLMGIRRSSFISGGDLIRQYKEYLISGSKSLLDNLITHNHDDLTGLVRLTGLLSVYNLFHGMYGIKSAELKDNKLKINICKIRLPVRINYATDLMTINALGDNACITVPVFSCRLKYFFKDYKNYYYLPKEDMAVHKTIAEYVDREYKKKATKETAYITKDSLFIRKGEMPAEYVYKESASSDKCYIELTDEMLNDREMLYAYVSGILK